MISELLNLKSEITGIPSEIQVLPLGSHKTDKGDFILDKESAGAIIEDFNSHQNDMVIDYEHQTLSGKEAPAAGWIKGLVNKGKDGVWAIVEWTERAREYLKNREYRYLSPVFLKRLSDNKIVRLINAGLTNQPAIDGMVPIVNKDSEQVGITEIRKEVSMEKLLEVLGLNPDTTEDSAISVVQTLKSQIKEISDFKSKIQSALGLNADATLSEVTGTVMAMKQSQRYADDLVKRVSELETQLRKRDADELVTQAMKEGKVTPAQKDWAMDYAETDIEGFKVFVSKAPIVIDTFEYAGEDMPGDGISIDEIQIQVNKTLGVSEETFKKHNK
ncbi:MAG: phage protease [Nitrospirae bacterium]|nr:phage protease [Nitrospirota bacterium]